MWPTTAISGWSPRPFTRATVVPSLSVVTSSANASAASRPTRAGSLSSPGGPGAVRRLRRSSEVAIGASLSPLHGRLDRHRAVQAVRDEAVVVRAVHELVDPLVAGIARDGDARAQRDLRNARGLAVHRHQRDRVVVIAHDVDPRLRGQVEEPQHLAGRRGHEEQLLRIEDRRIALRLAGRDLELLL